MEDAPVEPRRAIKREANRPAKRLGKKTKVGHVNFELAAFHAEKAYDRCEEAFFTQAEAPDKVTEIAFPEIDSPGKIRRYLKNPEAYVVTNLRKKASRGK